MKGKRNAALQPALHGKADLFASPLLLRASSVEVQPWQPAWSCTGSTSTLGSGSPSGRWFGGSRAGMQLAAPCAAPHRAGTAQGCPPSCCARCLLELHLASCHGLCPSATAAARASRTSGASVAPQWEQGMCGALFSRTRAKPCWWACCPNEGWVRHRQNLF